MQVISDYSLLHLLLAMMAHVNDLFNYFKQLVCKEDLLNFEFNCYYCHRQNFTILGIFLYCLHFLKLKLSLILSFYLPLIFKKMKLNLNYSLMDLLKNLDSPSSVQAFHVDISIKLVVLWNLSNFNTNVSFSRADLVETNQTVTKVLPVLELPLQLNALVGH